ncbi:hypothetical protein [Chitinophaga barathri]|uniref:Uncharacterized protein n=1 Tax=Chitinophaga barathri TaxID=1647451 RepID=A0A3N4MET7_9BACT|nr:hypothetical protein [Chitinophaga barathri]RPD42108.1 hypothetical protein EG028_08160 [Chitinophaga barathri]
MPVTLTMTDESAGGKVLRELEISFASELTTISDIITTRVRAEVEAYNNKMPEYFNGLIQPGDAERTINGFKIKAHKKVDASQQCATALDAYTKNGFFVLVDNIQSTSLDQMVLINENTRISFIKLTPLVGG